VITPALPSIVAPVALLALIFVPMLVEAWLAAHNERTQRALGGVEPPGDVYEVMRVAYPAAFAVMIAEGVWRQSYAWWEVGLAIFIAAKVLKWWAVASLGPFWTFRVIVRPGAALVASGPYRFLRHPNYVAVGGELVGAALMSGARVSGPLMTLGFVLLMLKRIGVEDRALERGRRDS
jgi:methyltransferase